MILIINHVLHTLTEQWINVVIEPTPCVVWDKHKGMWVTSTPEPTYIYECGRAAYCRGTVVILPSEFFSSRSFSALKRALTHLMLLLSSFFLDLLDGQSVCVNGRPLCAPGQCMDGFFNSYSLPFSECIDMNLHVLGNQVCNEK